jgi:hypothetical protein
MDRTARGFEEMALGGEDLRFQEISFRLKSPAIITERQVPQGYKGALQYIPASTLRGALLSSFFYHGKLSVDGLSKERDNPTLFCTHAYPLGNEKSWPSHPFLFKCKVCGTLVNSVVKVLSQIESGNEPSLPFTCSKGHMTLKAIHPRPVFPGGRREARVESFSSVCVAVSKERAACEGGLLFEYDAIAAGQRFWARIGYEDDLSDLLDSGFEFWIGRGISRGFGWAEVTGVEDVDLKKEAESLRDSIVGGRTVLYALSHLFSAGGTCFPQKLDLGEISGKIGTGARGTILLRRAYGRVTIYDSGWDMAKGERRPALRALCPGSLVEASVSSDVSLEALAALSIIGTVEEVEGFRLVGINQLIPLRATRWMSGDDH